MGLCIFSLFAFAGASLCLNKHLQIMLYIFLFALMYNGGNLVHKNSLWECVGKFVIYIIAPTQLKEREFSLLFPFFMIYHRRKFFLSIFDDGMLFSVVLLTARVRCWSIQRCCSIELRCFLIQQFIDANVQF